MGENDNRIYTEEEVYANSLEYFNGDELATSTFVNKYALKNKENIYLELTPEDMHDRLSKEFTRIEQKYPNPKNYNDFRNALGHFKYIVPGGNLLYGVGNNYVNVSLSNCTALSGPEDSISGIFDKSKDLANLFKGRSGCGLPLDSLRPEGSRVNNSAGTSTGAWSFANYYSEVCRLIGQAGRRGALILTMNVKHPDIEKFVIMKRDLTKVTGANISVMITDEFMNAVKNDEKWELQWPIDIPINEAKYKKTIQAKDLWFLINESATQSGEPGLIFIDNYKKNLPADYYPEFKSVCVNPCSEIMLSDSDSCRLTSINLKNFIINPFEKDAYFDFKKFEEIVRLAMRILDNIVDLEIEYLTKMVDKFDDESEIQLWTKLIQAAEKGRRTGLGTHGFADALACLGLKYDTGKAQEKAEEIYSNFRNFAYDESVNLAIERGVFSCFDWEVEKNCDFIKRLPQTLQDRIKQNGRRNISLLTNAPTGSVSIISQTSSGIEPVFMNFYTRRKKISNNTDKVDFVDDSGDKWGEYPVFHHNVMEYIKTNGELKNKWDKIQKETKSSEWASEITKLIPDYFITAMEIDPYGRVKIQGIIQKNICHGISSCLTGDSLIQTDKGLLKIEEIVGETPEKEFRDIGYKLRSINSEGKPTFITQTYNNGYDDVLFIKTAKDFNIKCTKNHRLLTLNEKYEQVWKYAHEIKIGDILIGRMGLNLFPEWKLKLETLVGGKFEYIKNTNSKNIKIPTKMTRDLARLIGYLCSDGSVGKNGISLSQMKNNICDDFINIVDDLFGITCNIQEDSRSENLVSVVVNSRELREFFLWLGLKNHNKVEVPLVIRKSPKHIVKEFIKGTTLDGYVSEDKIGVFTSVSYDYAKQVQMMLLNLGIDSGVSHCNEPHLKVFPTSDTPYMTKDAYCLYLPMCEAEKFVREIGFAEDRKIDECITKLKRSSRIKVKGEIPDHGLRTKFRDEILPNIKSDRLYNIFNSLVNTDKQGRDLSRESLQELSDIGLVVQDFLLDNTYIFRKVQSVELLNEQQPTFDLHVPDGNSYLSNGIINHNTLNLPKGTTVEQVQAIYESAWDHQLKGVTVYVDGSRSGVLINQKDDSKIKETIAPKRPKELPCEIHHSTIDDQKWTIFVGLLDGKPYEIFGGLSEYVTIPKRYKIGKIVKTKNGKKNVNGRWAFYNLVIDDDGDPLEVQNIAVTFNNGNYAAQTRMISLALRNGVPAQYIAEQLGRDENSDMFSFHKVMARVLKKYVEDGTEGTDICDECGEKLVFEGGCVICKACSYSPKCS